MGRRKTLCAMVILISLLALLPAAAQDRILIGVVAPLSGPGETEGKQFVAGVTAALKELKQIANRPVEIIIYDHQSKPDLALQMSRRLTESERADFLIIKGNAFVMLPIVNESERKHTPTVFVGLSKTPFLNQQQNYSFHIGDTVEYLAKLAVRYAKDNQGGRASFLFESTYYADAIGHEAKASQLQLQNWNSTASSPAIVFAFDQEFRTTPFNALPPNSLMIGGMNLKSAQGQHGNQSNVAIIAPHDPSLQQPRGLPDTLKSVNGADAYYGYAAFQILARAAQNNPASDRVAERMRTDSFETVVGRLSFMAGGECRQPKLSVYVMNNNNGSFQLCPDCAGVHDGCNGSACKCKDNSCSNDCCNNN